jgi:hypothetical protein
MSGRLGGLYMAVDRFIEDENAGGEFLDRKMIKVWFLDVKIFGKIKRLLSEIKNEYKELRGTDFNSEMNMELLRFVKDLK